MRKGVWGQVKISTMSDRYLINTIHYLREHEDLFEHTPLKAREPDYKPSDDLWYEKLSELIEEANKRFLKY